MQFRHTTDIIPGSGPDAECVSTVSQSDLPGFWADEMLVYPTEYGLCGALK